MRPSQGILPSVSEGRRTAATSAPLTGHSPSGGRPSPSPSSDGTPTPMPPPSSQSLPSTDSVLLSGTALLPAVGSGPNRSPSRRISQPPAQHLAVFANRHVPPPPPPPQSIPPPQPLSSDGISTRFHHVVAAGGDNAVATPSDGSSGAATTITAPITLAPASPLRADVIAESVALNSTLGVSDDRLLPPPPPPPIVTPLGVSPPAVTSAGRGRRSLTSMGMAGNFGRPGGARRSLSPNPSDQQPRIVRTVTNGGGAAPLAHSTSTVSSYYRAPPLLEAPSSPGAPMQPRPPLQVTAAPLLDDPAAPAAPLLHAGALMSPRVMRTQLVASGAPLLHSLGPPLRMPSGRQGGDSDELQERFSGPDRRLDEQHPVAIHMGAAAAVTAVEGPPADGAAGGDAKQMIAELMAAVGDLQRRVSEMSPRLPHDAAAVSDAGSGYSWCTSNRSSAPGNASGIDSSSLSGVLSIGPCSISGHGTGSNSGVMPVLVVPERATDERLAVLEMQMKQLAALLNDANAAAAPAPAPLPQPPPGSRGIPAVRVSASDSGGSALCRGGRADARAERRASPPFWSESGSGEAAEAFGPSGPSACSSVSLASAAVLGLALGFTVTAGMRRLRGANGNSKVTAAAASRQALGKLELPPQLPAGLTSTSSSAAPGQPAGHHIAAAATAEVAAVADASPPETGAAGQHVRALEERLAALERACAAAKIVDTAAAEEAGDAAAQPPAAVADEQHQRQLLAAVAEAAEAAVQASLPKQAQLEARLQACEQQLLVQEEQLSGLQAAKLAAEAAGAVGTAYSGPEVRGLAEAEDAQSLLGAEAALADQGAQRSGDADSEAPAVVYPTAAAAFGESAVEWRQRLEALSRKVRDVALEVTSARAQSSSCTAEIQAVLEQVRAVQATANAAAASARQASTVAAAAERTASAALDVVDAAATATRVNAVGGGDVRAGDGTRRRSRSTSGGGAAAAGPSAPAGPRAGGGGGLQSPRRSEVWLADLSWSVVQPHQHSNFHAAASATAAAGTTSSLTDLRAGNVEEAEEEEEEEDGEGEAQEAWRESRPADMPPSPPLPTRRLATRDVGFRIQHDGADVVIGGGSGAAATLYGVSPSRTSVLEGALTRLAAAEATLKDLHTKVTKALTLRVTRDELRESMAQVDLKIRAAWTDVVAAAGGGAGSATTVFTRTGSLGLRAMSAYARLGAEGGGAAGSACDDSTAAMAAVAAAATAPAAATAVWQAAGQGAPCGGSAAPGHRITAWTHQVRHTGGGDGGGGGVSDSVSSRGGGGGGGNAELLAVLTQVQRSLGLVEQRLEAVEAELAQEAPVTAAGERLTALAAGLQQLQLQQQQLQLQLQLQPQQDRAVTAPPQVHSRSGSVVRRYGSGAASGGLMLGLDEQVTPVAPRVDANEGELARQMRALAEQVAALTGQGRGQARGRDLLRIGTLGGQGERGV